MGSSPYPPRSTQSEDAPNSRTLGRTCGPAPFNSWRDSSEWPGGKCSGDGQQDMAFGRSKSQLRAESRGYHKVLSMVVECRVRRAQQRGSPCLRVQRTARRCKTTLSPPRRSPGQPLYRLTTPHNPASFERSDPVRTNRPRHRPRPVVQIRGVERGSDWQP